MGARAQPVATIAGVQAADERRHPGARAEGWQFDFWLDGTGPGGAALGGSIALVLAEGTAWLMADVVGTPVPHTDVPLVAVRDTDLRAPTGRDLEVRGEGIWAALHCETPMEHWSAGLEAFALGFDDPAEAAGAGLGDRLPMGLDLEWEAAETPVATASGYGQGCTTSGEVLIGDGRVEITGHGHRRHWWGDPPWTAPGWREVAGQLGSTWLYPTGDAVVTVRPELMAPWPVMQRALCRFEGPAGTGRGWCSWTEPPGP